MKEFRLHKKFLLDGQAVAEVESCVEAMMILKETEKYNTSAILALVSAYLQTPLDDIDPDQKDEISEVCANLNKVFEMVNQSRLLNT